MIEPRIRRDLAGFSNVEFLWSDDISDEEQDELQARFLKDTGIHVNKDTIVKYASWLQNMVVKLEAKISRLKGINGKRT